MRRSGATPSEIEALYRARFGDFVRVAAAICHDSERGRDAVQSAFTSAVRNRRSFRREGPLEGWVWRMVVNEARSLARDSATVPVDAAAEPLSNGNGADTDPQGIRAWIAALPERQREAVFLRYFADLDYRSIADALEIELGTVSATLGAAHRSLRKRLEEVSS